MTAPLIERLNGPPDRLGALIVESEQQGLRLVWRLADDWASGANRFDRPGAELFVARIDADVIGVCGLKIDPYVADPSIGRVRHLYVLVAYRGSGSAGGSSAKSSRRRKGDIHAAGLPPHYYEIEMAAPVKAPMAVAEWGFQLIDHHVDPTPAITEYWAPRPALKVWEYLDREMTIVGEIGPPADPRGLALSLHGEDRKTMKAEWPLPG